VSVRTPVTVGVASSVANRVTITTGAVSAVGASYGARHHNDNDVTMTTAGLWKAPGDMWPQAAPL